MIKLKKSHKKERQKVKMVREKMYNKIQAHKQMGYSIRKCARELDIDRKTVRKYWQMGASEYTKYMSECCERSKLMDPYREEITELLERWPNITSAIIHDTRGLRHRIEA